MVKKILQHIADYIIRSMSKVKDDELFRIYYEMGIWLDDFTIRKFNIYLD